MLFYVILSIYILGASCTKFFETLCTADVEGLPNGSGTLTVFTNENGGILDDLIVTKVDESRLYVVSNAAMKHQDMKIMQEGLVKNILILILIFNSALC